MSRSGLLRAKHDHLVRKLLQDPQYQVRDDGTVWTLKSSNGRINDRGVWRRAGAKDSDGYVQIRYAGVRLGEHRISYQKHCGSLQSDLVVDHRNCDRSDNRPGNLQLVANRTNCYHRERRRRKRDVEGSKEGEPQGAAQEGGAGLLAEAAEPQDAVAAV